MVEVDPEDIWIYIYERGEVRYTDLIKRFVNSEDADPIKRFVARNKCAKQTLLNYKLRLEAEGKIDKKKSERTRRLVYYVPDKWKTAVKDLIDKRKMKEILDKMSPEEFQELKEEFYDTFIR
jgi:hypothetical protein